MRSCNSWSDFQWPPKETFKYFRKNEVFHASFYGFAQFFLLFKISIFYVLQNEPNWAKIHPVWGRRQNYLISPRIYFEVLCLNSFSRSCVHWTAEVPRVGLYPCLSWNVDFLQPNGFPVSRLEVRYARSCAGKQHNTRTESAPYFCRSNVHLFNWRSETNGWNLKSLFIVKLWIVSWSCVAKTLNYFCRNAAQFLNIDSLTHRLVVGLLITSHPDSLRRRSQSTRSFQD